MVIIFNNTLIHMKIKFKLYQLALTLGVFTQACAIDNEQAITFTSADDQSVSAFEGHFNVTENRNRAKSRQMPIHYVRFPSTNKNPGPPIVYLAGGPGGSGIATAKYRRFELFMAMREVADVIALEQRGTGKSDDLPPCESKQQIPLDRPINDDEYIELNRQALRDCFTFWQQNKVDYAAYNTPESVADLMALKKHLGVKKISLWGISYGSHLALAALKSNSDDIHKVIIASAEGLAQTIKYPARTDKYFDRLQAAFDTGTDRHVDIKGLMSRVHQKLSQSPIELSWQNKEGKTIKYFLQTRDMQQLASAMISDPSRAKQMLQLYQAVDAGITAPIQGIIQKYYDPEKNISFKVMSTAMDLASGIGAERRQEIETQAQTALLAGYLNFSLYFTDLAHEMALDLGEDFRTKPKSAVPTLLLSGTLDGRTYIESQAEAVSELSELTTIKVVNAGHNLFKSSPKVIHNMLLFMQDQPLVDHTITIEPPSFNH